MLARTAFAALFLAAAARGQSDPASLPVIPATDAAQLTANVDKDAIVTGKISSAAWSSTGKVMQIRFEGVDRGGFNAVVFDRNRKSLDEGFGGDAAKTLAGANVRIRGKLRTYKDHVELTIEVADQITIVEPTTQPAQ